MKGWVAKDKDGYLYAHYEQKPTKIYFNNQGWWENRRMRQIEINEEDLPEGINPKWSDQEPIEIEIKIVKKS